MTKILAVAGLAAILLAGGVAVGATVSYYRFEEGAGTAMLDTVGFANGTHNAAYSADVAGPAVPHTGAANAGSLYLNGTSWAQVVGRQFILNSGYGDATLEFYLKVPDQVHHSIFWSRIGNTDANRFNYSINPDGMMRLDYRYPGTSLYTLVPRYTAFDVPVDVWTHVAVVRTAGSGGTDIYSCYLNGDLKFTAVDATPTPPDNVDGWSIAGRSGYRMVGYIDEVRFSDTALSPEEFLNAPEPATLSLLAMGGLAAMRRRRKK